MIKIMKIVDGNEAAAYYEYERWHHAAGNSRL